jgi:phosphoribosylglycinamide formyltransferase-1
LAAGVTEHGVSIHFVTDELDGGPVIIQKKVPILPGDDAAKLAARVHEDEHRLYPRVIRWLAEGRLNLHNNRIMFDGSPLTAPLSGESV